MLAIALGIKAVHAGYRVYYTTAADLVRPHQPRRLRRALACLISRFPRAWCRRPRL